MTRVSVDQVRQESSFLLYPLEDPVLRNLRHAILIEEVFGIVLDDEQISGLHHADLDVPQDRARQPDLGS